MAKSNFIVRGGGDFSGLYREMNKTQKRLSTFQKGISKTMKTIGVVLGSLALGKLVKDSTKAAMQVESSMAQLGRIMGDSANEFENWAKTQSKAYGMAREEAFKYGATYGNLISTFAKDTKETTQYTTELLKASAVVASATGRTMEDTMERIRSGLLGNTEAIEDLGINVNVAMLESTKAFQQFAKGRSWQQLAFQEQQQIRLMAILEQANTKYGDSLAGTTATRQMMFVATLKNIRLNLGQAFLPIYSVVLPVLTSLASKLEYVTSVLSAFSQALFGSGASNQAKATQAQANAVSDLGDATEEAGKKAKGATAGFDEINKLSISEGGAGTEVGVAGSVPGVSMEGIETSPLVEGMDEVSIKAKEMADKVKTSFTSMKDTIVENKDIIVTSLASLGAAIASIALYIKFPAYLATISGLFTKLGVAIKGAWVFLAANPIMLVIAAIAALVAGLVAAYKTNDKFKERVDNVWASIKSFLTPMIAKLGETLKILWQNVFVPFGEYLLWIWHNAIVPVGKVLMDVLAVAFDNLHSIAKSLWQNVLVPLGSYIATVFTETIKAITEIFIAWWNVALKPIATFLSNIFKNVIKDLISVFEFLWHKVLKPLALYMSGIFKTTFDTVTSGIGDVIRGLETTFKGLINFIVGVFTGDWKRAWEGVKQIFKGVFDSLFGIVKVPLNLIIDAINKVIGGLNKLNIKIPDWVPGLGGNTWGVNIPKIPKLATGAITGVNSPFLAMVGDNKTQREVISPLDDLMGMISSAVTTAVQFNNQTSKQQGDIVLNIDGTPFARIIKPYLEKESNRQGTNMILKTT